MIPSVRDDYSQLATTYCTLKECNSRNDIYLDLINIGIIH